MSNRTDPNRVPLMRTAEQNFVNRSRRPPLFGSPEEMNQLVAPPTKKRKLTENAICNEKELKNSFCKLGDDQKKVLKVAGGRLQDVNVAFYNASDLALSEKKDVKIEEVWSDHKQETRGNLQTCHSYIEKVKEDKAKVPYASHHEYFKDRPKQSNNQSSSLLKMKNLKGLIPSSKFHYVRRRTSFSCKIEHKNTDASLYLPREHDSEPKVDVAANRRTNLAIPISMEAAQIGTVPLFSQILERIRTISELFHVSQVERKHSDNGTHDIDFKGSIGSMRDLEVRKKITKTYVRNKYRKPLFKGSTRTVRDLEVSQKITKTYVRNKYRKPFFKAEMLDLDALHLLTETTLNLGSGLIPSSEFHYVRRRTLFSCKIEHKNTDATLHLPKEHDSEPKFDVAANRRTNLAYTNVNGSCSNWNNSISLSNFRKNN